MTRIEIIAKSVYGQTKFYPSNPAASHLCDIAKTRTMTPEVLRSARAMGCEIFLNGDKTLTDMAMTI